MSSKVIDLIYYMGIASCAAQGAEKGRGKDRFLMLYYITNAFGGGLMRDVIFLKVHPWLFTLSALPDIVLVILIGYLCTYYFHIFKANEQKKNLLMRLVTIADAFGLGSFICIGMDKAFSYSSSIPTIVVCGYVTAIGGGILLSGNALTKFFWKKETICYHVVTLLGCCYYCIFRNALFLISFTVVGLFLTRITCETLCNIHYCSLVKYYREIFMRYPVIYDKNGCYKNWKFIKNEKGFAFYHKTSKVYLVQHRIRQC